MNYPIIDPVLVDFGVFAIHWYGFMYLLAFATFWLLAYIRIRNQRIQWNVSQLNDACFYMVLGVIIGGRAGYALFYGFEQFLDDTLWLFRIWEGGMSFHGGLLGVIAGLFVWCKLNGHGFWSTMDIVAPFVPLGLGLGRIGNFINTELPGRVTDSALGVHFPCFSVVDHNFLCTGQFEDVTRHVSSLYQAFAEGVVLFIALWLFSIKPRETGQIAGLFLLGYGLLRIATEFFRQPDPELGFILFGWLSMGQLLSSLMVIVGIALLLPLSARYLQGRT
ncbi:MAG: prolipoprotein diacylglyceryl transferase [Gammaproteobacteria bacterium]|nr:prolipoprotein diacylglyceryl transferase [Gammaproteobacteria bacterium]